MKKLIILIVMVISLTAFAQNSPDKWERCGTIVAYYGDPNMISNSLPTDYKKECLVYSNFNGESIRYKLIVGAEVYDVKPNPYFSQDEYDKWIRLDFMHRPYKEHKYKFPYVAGKYYFDMVFLQVN